MVGGGLIASLPPNAFLDVEARVIGREIVEVHIAMRRQKGFHFVAPVPHGPVDVQPDCVAAERASQVVQGGEKARVVAMGLAQ